MTAFYPAKRCLQVAKVVEEVHYDRVAQAYAAEEAPDCDRDVLKQSLTKRCNQRHLTF